MGKLGYALGWIIGTIIATGRNIWHEYCIWRAWKKIEKSLTELQKTLDKKR